MAIVGFVDSKGKPAPTFEQEVKARGFENFVVELLVDSSWTAIRGGKTGQEGEYEEFMLHKAEQHYATHPETVNLAKLVTGKFAFSGNLRAPAFHWFLTWKTAKFNFTKHPSVTESVLNALDSKGNSALFYCHREHYQSGWTFNRHRMLNLLEDSRFLPVDFPVISAYGGGIEKLALPSKAVEALVKRNAALKGAANAAVRQTVNSTRSGVSLLHMVCDEILLDSIASPALISSIRNHPDFENINHVAQPDVANRSGGAGNSKSHHLERESCVAAVLRKSYNKKRARIVEAVMARSSRGKKGRHFHLKPDKSLTGMAQDSLDKEAKVKDNGFRARIVALMAKRAVEDAHIIASASKRAEGSKGKAKAKPGAKAVASKKTIPIKKTTKK